MINNKELKEIISNVKSNTNGIITKITSTIEKNVKSIDKKQIMIFINEVSENAKEISQQVYSEAKELVSKMDKTSIQEIIDSTWSHLKQKPEEALDVYNKMDKKTKVAAISLMAGGAIVSIPFIIAAGPVSIISALAALGGGTLASGGFGVAGGIIVTAAGAALSSSFAGLIANKKIKDSDVEKLLEHYKDLETIVSKNYTLMEKHGEKFRKLYEKYAKMAEFVAGIQEKIENDEKYDSKEIHEYIGRIQSIEENINEELADIKQ